MSRIPQNPNEVVLHLAELSRQLDDVTRRLNEADVDAKVKAEDAKVAEAKAFVAASGAMDLRKAIAVVETHEVRLEARVAEAMVRGLQRESRTLHARIDVGRTFSATVRSEISLTGSGAFGS